MSIKITLDPGHGKTGNAYPPRPRYYEGTQMWKLANYLKAELEKYGFEVVTTRPNLTDDPSAEARGRIAGKNKDLFLSLHSNAPGSASDTTTTGTVVFYSMTDLDNRGLANKLGSKVSDIMGHHFRGSMTKEYPNMPGVDYYGVIREAVKNGCTAAYIIEHGFHTNIQDSAFLIVDANLQKLAVEEAKIIAANFGKVEKVEMSEIKQGDSVKITGNNYSNGAIVPASIKNMTHIVSKITGDKALLGYPSGIMSWVLLKNLTLVKSAIPEPVPAPTPVEPTFVDRAIAKGLVTANDNLDITATKREVILMLDKLGLLK